MALFKDYENGAYIKNLPIISPSYSAKNELITPNGIKAAEPAKYSLNFEKFKSIFDGAAIGQYLGGIDAGEKADLHVGFINESCVFNCSKLSFEWRKDDDGRYIPVCIYEDEIFVVNTLHIHSKDPRRFYSARLPLTKAECNFRSGRYNSEQIEILETLFHHDCKVYL